MVVEVGDVRLQLLDKFLDLLSDCMPIRWAGGGDGREAMVLYGFAYLLLAEVDQWANDREARAVKIGAGSEGVELAGVEEAHEEGLHCIVVMMGVSNLIHAVLHGIAVHGSPAEKGAGEAGLLVGLGFDGARNVHLHRVVGNLQAFTEIPDAAGIKVLCELGIDGQGGEGKFFLESLPHDGQGVGQEDAVLAPGNTDEDVVTLLNHLKFHNGSH